MKDRKIDPGDWVSAVADTDGPQLVVAGPGTGKTEFLVRRASHLLRSGRASSGSLLVLTFSRRAAADIRTRIATAVGRSIVPIQASTFHSFAARLLEAHAPRVLGWAEMPTLLTTPEQVSLVAELLRSENQRDWPPPFRRLLASPTFAADVADFLLRCCERRLTPDELAVRATEQPGWRAMPAFFRRYRAELDGRRRIDYGTLLDLAVDVASEPGTSGDLAARLEYVLVDEYQDTSEAQVALIDVLTRAHRNVTVAGDPYQSIYSFRGADLHHVADFAARFEDLDHPARRLVLSTSFRVPAPILDAALRITASGELPGGAGPVTPAPHAGSVEAYVFDQASAEAEWIASEAERLHLEDRIPYSAMAVLLRSKRRLLPELSRALARRSIPHDSPDTRLVDHPAVRIILDLALAADLAGRPEPGAADELDRALRRVLLGPLFRLGVGAERQLMRRRRREGLAWSALLTEGPDGGRAIAELISDPGWAVDAPAIEGFWYAWDRLPHLDRFIADPAAGGYRAAWSALAQALERQAERDRTVSLASYRKMTDDEGFEATPLLSLRPAPEDRLTLTTLHQAKGLEFEVVFIADATDDMIPDLRRGISLLDTHALSPGVPADAAGRIRFRLQEEMRLAYTAMTRARRRVVWTATSAGIDEDERRPSRFLMAVSGAAGVADVPAPPRDAARPVTPRQVETFLRRLMTDPGGQAAQRLAATAALAVTDAPWEADRFAGLHRPGPDTGVVRAPFRLSPTQAEDYLACPRRYALERRLRVEDTTGPSAAFGSLVHEVLELVEQTALLEGRGHARLDEALSTLDRLWVEKADFGSPGFNLVWKRKAVELLTRMWDEWPTDSRSPVELEFPLRLELEGITWSGRADRIERAASGGLRIIDYKTSTTVPSVARAAESLQLGFYLLAARADPKLTAIGEPTEAELWFPRGDRKEWRRRFDPANLGLVEETLVDIGRRITAEDWGPTVGDACRWCAVRSSCPLWPEGRPGYEP